MKQFKTILKFELNNLLNNKTFKIVTIAIMVIIAGVMFFPRIKGMIVGDGEGKKEEAAGEGGSLMLIAADASVESSVQEAFKAAFPGYNVQFTSDSIDEIKEKIDKEEAECAFVLKDITDYTYIVGNLSMYDDNMDIADETLLNLYRMKTMAEKGISAEEAEAILNTEINYEVESLGKDQGMNFFYTYIMIFALYMVILMYGQMVATNVASEKSTRAMEVLVTSAKPASMMFGKVLASTIAGFVQLICIFGSAFLFYNLNKEYWGENPIIRSIFDMPLNLLVYMLVFFVLGFLVYAFMYGAVGSTVSKLEDINTAVMPITMIFIIAFMVTMFSMSSGNVDNILMKICSYIPFTSPMAMFTRIVMSTVPWYSIAISILILIGSVIGIGFLAAKIYRVGVLLYGTAPKIGTLIKSIFEH